MVEVIRSPVITRVHSISRIAALSAFTVSGIPVPLKPPPPIFSRTVLERPVYRPTQIANRGFIGPNRLYLRGRDTFFGGPGQVPTRDWPNPVRRPWRPSTDVLGRVVMRYDWPWDQTNWPNPVRRPWRPSTDVLGRVVMRYDWPWDQTNYPNPVRRIVRQTDTNGANLSLTAVTNVPFDQPDWPNPTRLTRRQDFQQGSRLTLDPALGTPFEQTDWPNPVLRCRPPLEQAFGVNIALYSVASTLPFTQADWPNPYRRPNAWQQPGQYGYQIPASAPAVTFAILSYMSEAPIVQTAAVQDTPVADLSVMLDEQDALSLVSGVNVETTAILGDTAVATIGTIADTMPLLALVSDGAVVVTSTMRSDPEAAEGDLI